MQRETMTGISGIEKHFSETKTI